jgi:ATP-binding cassette subfamily B protein
MAAIFSGLETEAYDRAYSDTELIKRIASYFGLYRKRVTGVIILVSLVALAGVGQPLIVSSGIGSLAGEISTLLIAGLTGLMTIFGVGVWLANWWRRRLQIRVIGDVVSDMRRDAFTAAINHDMAFFDEFESGHIISRITTDTNEFIQVVQLVTELFTQILLVLILLVVLFSISWQLTLVLLALGPFVAVLTVFFRRLARFVTRKAARVLARVNASIQEAVTGISIAKNFRQEAAIYNSFVAVNEQSAVLGWRVGEFGPGYRWGLVSFHGQRRSFLVSGDQFVGVLESTSNWPVCRRADFCPDRRAAAGSAN